jgi:DNA-binding NtrC family response regulator
MVDILLIDDEPSIRLSVADALREAGHSVTVAADGEEGLAAAASRFFEVIISDVRLPKVDGISIFHRVHADSPLTDFILITAFGTVTDAVHALKEGAQDYLLKPFDTDEILIRVARAAEKHAMRRALEKARDELTAQAHTRAIIGRSPAMARLLDRIETLATCDSPVLITGESGTGKELVARSLHDLSARKHKPFVAVNCAAFPETLLEAELFGHDRGAFTGALKKRDGRFMAADGGTLFLDEIAEIPPNAQAKMLRVLQDGMVEQLGSDVPVRVDVRIISATHQDLKQRIASKLFREDLYYRLKVLDVFIPPLRERRSDLPLLVEHFLEQWSKDGAPPCISPRAWRALNAYPFPGNVRELQHALERAVVLARGKEIDLDHLPEDISGCLFSPSDHPAIHTSDLRLLHVAMKEFEREYLLHALALADNKRIRAADMLGISRKNLWEKLRAHGITAEEISHAA